MLFGSLEFYLFFAVVFSLWLSTPVRHRWTILLFASYVFYLTWQPWFASVLAFCTVTIWWLSIRIAGTKNRLHKKRLLIAAAVAGLSPLLFFKYFNFFSDSLESLLPFTGSVSFLPHLTILLPVGISFYSLTAIAYSIDVYEDRIKPERHLGIFALFLSFFPKLISGPIERGKNLLPQLQESTPFNSQLFVSGIHLFFWGLFKKVVIADRMAMYVDMVFNQPQDYWGWSVIIAVWLFTLQIYCDFSAYTDMAIGCGRIFGIELSQNFNFPYMARSIQEFWKRWHITLTSWFMDYLYIPLGGNRVSAWRWALNIMAVFLVSGLWHGAAWNFIFWGGIHGFFYLFGKVTAPVRARLCERIGLRGNLLSAVQIFVTFNLLSLAWIFFRAASQRDALLIIKHLFMHLSMPVQMLSSQFSTVLAWTVALVFILLELMRYRDMKTGYRRSRAIPAFIKYPTYVTILLAISLLGVSSHPFIYFHF